MHSATQQTELRPLRAKILVSLTSWALNLLLVPGLQCCNSALTPPSLEMMAQTLSLPSLPRRTTVPSAHRSVSKDEGFHSSDNRS